VSKESIRFLASAAAGLSAALVLTTLVVLIGSLVG
jgi:hypothetical protein